MAAGKRPMRGGMNRICKEANRGRRGGSSDGSQDGSRDRSRDGSWDAAETHNDGTLDELDCPSAHGMRETCAAVYSSVYCSVYSSVHSSLRVGGMDGASSRCSYGNESSHGACQMCGERAADQGCLWRAGAETTRGAFDGCGLHTMAGASGKGGRGQGMAAGLRLTDSSLRQSSREERLSSGPASSGTWMSFPFLDPACSLVRQARSASWRQKAST